MDRLTIFNAMPQNLKEIALILGRGRKAEARGLALIKYDMGLRLKLVLAQEKSYGGSPIEWLSAYLGVSDADSYACRKVATVFSRNEVEELVVEPMANGRYFTFRHFIHLAAVPRKSDRLRLIQLARASAWPARRLAREIRTAGLAKPFSVPGTVEIGPARLRPNRRKTNVKRAQQIFRIVITQLELEDPVQFDVESILMPDEPDPPLVSLIREILAQVIDDRGDDTDRLTMLKDAWVTLSRMAEVFSRAVAPLGMAVLAK